MLVQNSSKSPYPRSKLFKMRLTSGESAAVSALDPRMHAEVTLKINIRSHHSKSLFEVAFDNNTYFGLS